MRPFQFSQFIDSFFKKYILFGHLLSQFSLKKLDIVDVIMVDLSFRFEFVKLHLHRLVIYLQFFHELSVAFVLLEEFTVLSA